MTTTGGSPAGERAERVPARDVQNWAKPVDRLNVSGDLPPDAMNRNVEGRHLSGLAGGFGKLWQKTYRIRLEGAEVVPSELIATWKARFPEFWRQGNRFYGSLGSISPGDVALLNLAMPGRVKLSTGILVLYADEESFSFMTPEGHMFAGMITFSAREEDGATVAQIQALIRAQDPLYELMMMAGGHRAEDKFWKEVLQALAVHFGASSTPEMERVRVDRRRQWRHARNIWHNAVIRSILYTMGTPFRWIAKPFHRKHA